MTEHLISTEEFSVNDQDDRDAIWDEENLKPDLAEHFLEILQERKAVLKRGDTVLIETFGGYRNDGRLIFDGIKIIHLEFEPDDYGTVPKQFHILEAPDWFEPNHFSKVDHNMIVWFHYTAAMLALFLEKIIYTQVVNETNGQLRYFCYSTIEMPFKDGTHKVTIIYDHQEGLPLDDEDLLCNRETGEIGCRKWIGHLLESFKRRLNANETQFERVEDEEIDGYFEESFLLRLVPDDLIKCPVCHQSETGGGSDKDGSYYRCAEGHRFILDANFEFVSS